jgi:hypothetical protein
MILPLANEQQEPSNYLYDPNLNLYIVVRTIFPHEAESILEGQVKNRSLSKATIKRYAQMMSDGAWMLNGETIVFADGQLINGQHRLNAVIDSKVPLTAIWVEVGNKYAFRTLDQGKKRGNSDVLSIAGYTSTHNLAACLGTIVKIDTDWKLIGNGAGAKVAIPNYEIEEYIKRYPGLENSVKVISKWHKMLKIRRSSLAVLHYLLRRVDGGHEIEGADSSLNKSDEFLDQVFEGINLHKGSPALALRNAFIRGLSEGRVMEPGYIIKAGIICWNNWLSGKQMKVLRVERESAIPKPKKS